MFRNFSILIFLISAGCMGSTEHSEYKSLPEAPEGMAFIPGGELDMGGDNEQASSNEYPKHRVEISPFFMDTHEVTNDEYALFIEKTGYVTVAERGIDWEELKQNLPQEAIKPPDSLLLPGALVFHKTARPVALIDVSQWWEWTLGANWKHPEGPNSSIEYKGNHPVVQISWEDAQAYAKWADKRLPTEAEWEWASRGGLQGKIYPWGDADVNEIPLVANFWQGLFPHVNTLEDGYLTTAPRGTYKPNKYGLYDMAGNVWEWCEDWFDHGYYNKASASEKDTKGPNKAYNPMSPYLSEKVIRGGSFLCNDDFCSGYRNARRMGSTPDTGLNHTGFRCVKDLN